MLNWVQIKTLIPAPAASSKQEKCAQYWPTAEETETAFRDTGFLVAVLSEDVKSYYTTRVLELQNLSVGLKMMKTVGSRPVESSGQLADDALATFLNSHPRSNLSFHTSYLVHELKLTVGGAC